MTFYPDVYHKDESSMYPGLIGKYEIKFHYNKEALWIFFMTGNDLYLKFPKKLRRRRRR